MVCMENLKNIAVAIPCYRRPEFLDKCVAAVAKMPEVRAGAAVYLLADGGPESAQAQCVETFLKHFIPERAVIYRSSRYRQPRNIILGKQELFTKHGHDWVALIEEDVVVAPNWLTLMLALQSWADQNFDNCGMVGSCIVGLAHDPAWVSDGGQSICNHLISKRSWRRLWPLLLEFLERVSESEDLTDQRVIRLQAWINELAERIPEPGPKSVPDHWQRPPQEFYRQKAVPASQDVFHDLALRLAGMTRLACDACRAVHIGNYGEHATGNEQYATELHDWPEDAARTSFVLRKKRPVPPLA